MAAASTVRIMQTPVYAVTPTTDLPYGSDLARGSLLVLVFLDSGDNAPVVTDSLGNTWKQLIKSAASSYAAIFYATNTKPGPNTISASGGGGQEMWAWEINAGLVVRPSMPGVVIVDASSGASGLGTTANPGTVTPSHPSVFLVSATRAAGGQTVTGGALGWSFDHNSARTGVQTLIPSSIAAQTGSFSIGLPDNWDAVCGSFAFPNPDAAAIVQPKLKPFLV
jgi:hypothetical protein